MEINDIKEEIDAINKKFNSNILMYENFDIKEKIEVISTGSIGLDWKTVCGGIPRARVTEIIGPESSSKCLSGETYINSDQGILTIKELFLLNNVIPSCTNKIINKNINLQNRYNKLEESIYFVCNNRQKVKTIETKSGFKITGTYNHPLLIMDKDGFIIWKNIKELNIGDYLISPRQTISGNLNFDFQTMYSLGILIADGRFEKNRISITNDDENIKNFIETSLSLFLKINYKKYNNNENGSFNYHFNNKEKVTDFYNKFQYSIGKSKDKNVSIIIRQCNIESLKYFIQGYFDCKSSVNYSKVVITVTSASYILLYQIKLILQQLGIISILRKKFVKKYPNNNYYSLEICGQETIKFINIVGTYSTKIRNRYNKILNKKRKESTNIDSIPYLNNIIYTLLKNSNTTRKDWNLFGDIILNKKLKCTYNRLKNILSRKNVFENKHLVNYLIDLYNLNYFYDPIIDIKENNRIPTFDISMSNTASFIADGIISHNTTLCGCIIANAQKNGGMAAMIDAEHDVDLNYYKNLGVDFNRLVLSQPDTMEEALEITENLLEWNKFDVIIFDSVAALSTRAELEGEIEDQQMGDKARLMGKSLRRITSILGKTKTALVFTNQIRDQINKFGYGPSTTTPAGRALKFKASLRISLAIEMAQVKVGDIAIGSRIKAKIIKNKVGQPFGEWSYTIIWNKGIVEELDILEVGIEVGIINKKGSWYSYGETQLGQGLFKSSNLLKENIELKEKIKNDIWTLIKN